MNNRIHDLMNYLDSAHSVFHAVEGLRNILEENGYRLHSAVGSKLEIYQKE